MASAARDNIIARLKKFRQPVEKSPDNSADQQASSVLARELTTAAGLSEGSTLSAEQRVERFISAIELAHAEIVKTKADRWINDLHQHLVDNNLANLLYAPGGGEQGQGTALSQHDFGDVELIPFDQPVETFKDDLFDKISAGISYGFKGIAHTGTIILKTGPNEPRTMSLVPPVHYVVLDSKVMYNNLIEAFADPEVGSELPTNLLLISGPSKTADIQQTLAYGAHGPKRLIVLLLE